MFEDGFENAAASSRTGGVSGSLCACIVRREIEGAVCGQELREAFFKFPVRASAECNGIVCFLDVAGCRPIRSV